MLDDKMMMDHLQGHITYPATKAQLVAACNNMSDVNPQDKTDFAAKLPEGTYNSADDVMKALGMQTAPPPPQTPPATSGAPQA